MTIALKEWATVIRALAQGEQIFILRKGGLAETKRGFELAHRKFVFFPTWEHQQREQLAGPYKGWFDQLEPGDPSKLRISAMAEAAETLEAPADRERWRAAIGLHVWNDAYINMRYDYRPDLPLRLVLLRASVLPEPMEIPADQVRRVPLVGRSGQRGTRARGSPRARRRKVSASKETTL